MGDAQGLFDGSIMLYFNIVFKISYNFSLNFGSMGRHLCLIGFGDVTFISHTTSFASGGKDSASHSHENEVI